MPDQAKHHFLTVLLTDKFLQSSLVSNNGQGIQIKEFSEIKSYFDRQDLVDQLDKSLQQLGSDSQDVVETIFAFDHDWLEDGELSDVKKAIVKEVTEELSLEAVGQFSVPEALAEARLIGDEHDSCLLTVFKEDVLDLVFLKHGQFLDLISVGRSGNVVDDFNELLARAAKHLGQDGKYFPSKVLMTSIALKPKEMATLHEELVAVDWVKNPGFTQAPTIVVLEPDYMIKSVSLSAGKVFAKESMLAKMPSQSFIANQEPTQTSALSHVPEVVEEPVAKISQEDYAIERKDVELVPKGSASSFGIDFSQSNLLNHNRKDEVMSNPEPANKPHKKRSLFGRFYLSHKKMILIGIGTGLLGLLSIFTAFAFFLSKVTIMLTPEQSLLQKSIKITLDPNLAESDFDKALLKADLEQKEISGQDVTATTGIGLVGDKAKGKVAIYNKTIEKVKFKEGTIISNDGVEFLIDKEVEIAEATEKSGGSGMDYGKTEVEVTAKDIGSEANFNKETKFRVADYFDDKFSAVALDNFSGGSSREVRVVAQVDLDRLTKDLSQTLVEEAMKEFEEESVGGTYFVPTGNNKPVKSNFSAELGAETESLTLDLTLEVEAVKYLSADLKKLGLALLEKDLPVGYSFVDQDPSLLSDKAQVSSSSAQISLTADLSAKAMADLDLEEIKQQVLGKSWLEAEEQLENNSEIKQAQVIFQPPFLINILRNLPSDPSRVILELSSPER